MADKFKDYETPICSDWLNTVDDAVFDALLEPKTPDEARTNIGAVNGEEVVIIGDAHYSQLGHNHDHGQLDGLADDDHTQYHNDTRGDARYSQTGHTHSEYIGDAPVDGNYYARRNAAWELSPTGGGGATDHGALTGLADDDHTQYHNDTRGDARYVPLSRSISGVASIGGGGDLSQNRAFSLVNDSLIPGANQTYGTDANGERGWFSRTTTTVYSGTWTFQNPTTPPPTGASIRRNNTTPENVTQIYITETDADGVNQTVAFSRLIAYDKLAVRLESDQALSVEYRLTGPGSDNGSFWTFPVEYVSGAGAVVADGTRVDVDFIHGEVSDHGTLTGLADDDHTQYYNQTRGDARYSQTSHNHDHGALTGLADDDHTQYHNDARGDARYSQLAHVHSDLEFRPRKNFIINGNFDIWQRGNSFNAPSVTSFCADRWIYPKSGQVMSRRSVDGELTGSFYCLTMTATNTAFAQIITRLEALDAAKLRFKTVTLSCYARSTSGTFPLGVEVATPSAYDNFGTTTIRFSDGVGKTLSSTWTKYSWTFEVATQARFGLQVLFYRIGTGNSTTEFAQIQLEIGDTVSDFEHEHVVDTLARCRRYYQEFPETLYGSITQINFTTSQGTRGVVKDLPVAMRIAPTTTQTLSDFTAGYVGHTTTSLVWAETAWATVTNLASVSAVKATAELT